VGRREENEGGGQGVGGGGEGGRGDKGSCAGDGVAAVAPALLALTALAPEVTAASQHQDAPEEAAAQQPLALPTAPSELEAAESGSAGKASSVGKGEASAKVRRRKRNGSSRLSRQTRGEAEHQAPPHLTQLPPPQDPPPSSAIAPLRAAAEVASAASVTSVKLQTHAPNKDNVPAKQVRELEEGEVEESDEEQNEVPPSTGTPRGGSRLTRPPAVDKAAQRLLPAFPKPSSLPASGTKRPRSPARPSSRLGPADSRAKDSKQKAPETGSTTDRLVQRSGPQNEAKQAQSSVVRRGEINNETVMMLAPAARASNTDGACLSTGKQEKNQLKPRLRPGKNERRRKQALEKEAEKEEAPIASSLTSPSLLQRAHHPAIAQDRPPSPPHPPPPPPLPHLAPPSHFSSAPHLPGPSYHAFHSPMPEAQHYMHLTSYPPQNTQPYPPFYPPPPYPLHQNQSLHPPHQIHPPHTHPPPAQPPTNHAPFAHDHFANAPHRQSQSQQWPSRYPQPPPNSQHPPHWGWQ
jgi:hypothetical protein